MHVTCNVVFELFRVVSDQSALLCSTLAALTSAHINIPTWKDVSITDVLSNEDLFIIVFSFVVEADEAELVSEDIRENLGESELFLLLCCISGHI